MADAQIAIIDGDQTQVVLAPGENPAIVTSIPGPQGPAGAGVPTGGAANEVLYKVSSTFGDTAWGPITSAMIGDLQIVNADVSASAGIAYSKLATLTSGNIVLGNASNVATSTAVTGDVTISNAGVTAISSGVIVDADVNASAAIAGTKISPNFGSQNVTTTGTSTAASFIPTSSTAPTNGLYLSAANSVALSTNGQGRVFIDSSGRVGIGTASPVTALHVYGASSQIRVESSTGTDGNIRFINTSGSMQMGLTGAGGNTFLLYDNINGALAYQYAGAASAGTHTWFTNNTERLRITSTGQLSHIGAGSSGSPAVSFSGSAASNSLVVDSSSRVGIGTSSVSARLHITDLTAGAVELLRLQANLTDPSGNKSITWADSTNVVGRISLDYASSVAKMRFGSLFNSGYQTSDLMTLTPTGLGIGTTSPTYRVHASGTTSIIKGDSAGASSTAPSLDLYDSTHLVDVILTPASGTGIVGTYSTHPFTFYTNNQPRATIDTSGRLLVGTSSTSAGSTLVLQGNTASSGIGIISLANTGSSPVNGEALGVIRFTSNTHNAAAAILAARDAGTWTSGSSEPTRLTFFTTSDASASPTERMRITSAGVLQVADAGNIAVGTTTGTKIGTATTQKLGFFNKTPVVQPAAVADATDAASVITQLNALLARMRDLGLIAT